MRRRLPGRWSVWRHRCGRCQPLLLELSKSPSTEADAVSQPGPVGRGKGKAWKAGWGLGPLPMLHLTRSPKYVKTPGSKNGDPAVGWCQFRSATDGDGYFGAPLADLGVADSVDGLVGPFGGGGWEGGGSIGRRTSIPQRIYPLLPELISLFTAVRGLTHPG